MQRLTDREFSGVVIKGEDPKNCGRYCVLINELMYNIYDKEEGFIYCNNHVTNHRSTSSDNGIYGQYFPLHPGTKVIVKFFAEDFETGYIDRIISDYYDNSMPLGIPTKDRDQYYQILRTIANDLIAVTHETDKIPKNGIHIYHKNDQTQIVFDENGLHIYSKKDFDQRIDGKAFIKIDKKVECIFSDTVSVQITGATKINIDSTCDVTTVGDCKFTTNGNSDITIDGNSKITTKGISDIKVDGDCKILSGGICHIKSTSDCNIESSSNCNVKAGAMCSVSSTAVCNINAGGMCNIDGAMVNINCKMSVPASPATSASSSTKSTKPTIVTDPKAPLIPFDEKKAIPDDFI